MTPSSAQIRSAGAVDGHAVNLGVRALAERHSRSISAVVRIDQNNLQERKTRRECMCGRVQKLRLPTYHRAYGLLMRHCMRGVVTIAAGLILLSGIALAQPEPACPPETATLTVFVDNRTDPPVDVEVDVEGGLAADAVTCVGSGGRIYPMASLSCGPGRGVCGTIGGLQPGAWVHRMTVTVPGSVTQEQAQRAVMVGGDPIASNVVVWTVYPRAFVVSTTASDDSPGSLRAALSAAGDYTSTSPGPALVTFSRDLFQSVALAQTIDLAGGACDPDTRHAALCFRHSRIVVDGLDRDAKPGAVVWSVGTQPESVLRVYGSENVFRGIVFQGSAAEVIDPTTCGEEGGPPQADTVALTGPEAHDNTLDQCLVLGPTCGDGIGVDNGAAHNFVTDSRITGAQDKGLKANAGSVTIQNSCVHGNHNGGIQSTLGGNVNAEGNVVQDNAGGQGQNGLTAIDQCRADNLGCTHELRSNLATLGNIVRFSGTRGISVAANASGIFNSDYVANNLVKGAVVENTARVPLDADGHERVPSATFHGVALVCNYSDGYEGVGAETRSEPDPLELGQDPPDVNFGDAESPGRNAFTSNRGFIPGGGANFLLTNVTSPISAQGNQWGHCSDTVCDEDTVRTLDIRPPLPSNSNVTLVEPGATFDGPRAGKPVIYRVVPTRPQAGEIVRIYGDNFDAINGNPTRLVCPSIALPQCSPEQPCSTGPCVDGLCPCAIDNPAVQARNTTSEDRILLIALDGTGIPLAEIAPDAVTPTMLVFRMPPFDCFEGLALQVLNTRGAHASVFCDPSGCQDQPAATPCDDGRSFTIGDRCDGEGHCVGDSVTTTSTTIIPPSTSSTSSTISNSTTTTTTLSSTTTTTTLLRVCDLTVPSASEVAACDKPRLRDRAEKKLMKIEQALAKGRHPKCRQVRRLRNLLGRCE
jgi:hypothetical protein